MTLIVHELKASGLTQVVTPDKNVVVVAIRPHIYRHNLPTGNLKVQILDAELSVVAESAEVAIDDIGSLAYFHGYVRFDIHAYLAKDQAYTVKLLGADGYTFDEAAYCGWVNAYDLGKYPTDTAPTTSLHQPLDLEIWERKVK